MTQKYIALVVDEELHKRFKKVCKELGLLMGKQNEVLLRQFVEAQEHNIKLMKESRR